MTHSTRHRKGSAGGAPAAAAQTLAAIVSGVLAPAVLADTPFRTLVLFGDAAPGTSSTFTFFDAPLLVGDFVAFDAATGVAGSASQPLRRGLFAGRAPSFDALLLEGDEAPGAPGTQFRYTQGGFSPLAFNQLGAGGAIAFTAELSGSGVNATTGDSLNHRGIWSTAEGTLSLEMRSNDPAPAFGSDWRFSLPGAVALNDANEIAFWAAVKRGSFPTTEDRVALFTRDATQLGIDLLFDDSMSIQGLPTTFQQVQPSVGSGQVIDLPAPAFNAAGAALFMVDFANPAFHQGGRAEALVIADRNGARVVAHTARNNFGVTPPAGSAAPGLTNTVFTGIERFSLNDLGDVALTAAIDSAPGTVGVSGRGVWAGGPGALQLVAREGQALDEAVRLADAGFLRPLNPLQFNNRGEVALLSELAIDGEDPFTFGLVLGSASSLELVARTGAGGAFEGAVFTDFSDVALNHQGQLAFLAQRRDTQLAESFSALMMKDNAGLRTVVRTKRALEVRPGDLRMVSAIDVSDRYLSNNGELAYHLAFDGSTSGLFIAGAVQGVDFFLRGTGAGVVDWLDADWKDSLDLDTDAPGALGTELVTIEDANVRIVADAGTSTISVGRLNASGSLLLGEVIGGGPSLVINGSDAGDSSIESLHIDGGRLEIRDNLLIGGASEWTDAFVTIADDVSLTNSATLLIKDAVLDGEGLLINAGPGTLTLGSAASVAMSALKLINLGTLKAQAGSLEAIGFTTETVRNEGTFIKDADGSATLDVFTVSTAWENSGEVRIRGGELAVLNNGTVPSTRHLDGAHYRLEDTLASRSILRFGGAHEMSGAVTIDGAGLWLLDDATLDLTQAALGANVDMQWRAADVKTDGSVTDGVASGGLVLRAGRKLDIEAAATGERASRLTGVLDARGTVRQHEADLVLKQASIVLTHGGADSAWFLDGKADVLVDGAGSRFLNLNGVLQRQRGGESRFEAFYEGSSGSSVDVDGGSLVFAGGGEFNAASLFITGGGGERGRVRLERSADGTPYTVAGTLSIGGSDGGDFIIEDGAVLRTEEAGSVVFDAPDVTLDGGFLSGPGHFVNQATMHWKKGQLGLAAFGSNSATLENHHVLVIGDDAGERILAGSLLSRGELVQQRGVLSLSGGLVQLEPVGTEPNAASGGWQSSADIVVDANGGRVDVQKGARFAVVAQRQVTVAADFFNQGRVSLGTGSELQLTGEVGQNALGVLTGGGWTLDAHSRLALSGGQIETIGAGAEVDLGEGSVFDGLALSRNDGGLRLSAKATLDVAADLTNAGQFVAVDDAQLTVADLFDNPGQFTGLNAAVSASQLVNRGSLTLVGGSLVTTGVLRNEGEMRLDRVGVNAGVIFANEVGASLTLDAAVINAELFALNGAIHGTGILNGAVRQFGTLAPGASPGTLIVNGDFTAEPGSTLVIEFAGLAPGEFDLIEVHGDATLGGTLEIHLLDGYLPRAGDALVFLTVAGAIDGAFAEILFPGLARDFEFATDFSDGTFRVLALTNASAVPLPGGAGLFLIGLCTVFARGKRLPRRFGMVAGHETRLMNRTASGRRVTESRRAFQ